MGDIRMKLIANYLFRVGVSINDDAERGMPIEEIKDKYTDVLIFLDEIERVNEYGKLRRIK